jgi:hypothetical protein
MLKPNSLVSLLITTPPQMTEINVRTNNIHPITSEPMLTLFDIAMFLQRYEVEVFVISKK